VTKGALWPWIIAGALALHVAASLIVVAVATSDPSYAVEEDYYQKAVDWDLRRARDRASAALGWSLTAAVTPPSAPGERPVLEARIADAAGAPVEGATVAVECFHNARSHDRIRARLEAAGGGVYRAALPMRRDGRWELRFTVNRGAEHFVHRETRHMVVEGRW